VTNPTVVIEQELGKSIKVVSGLGPGVSGRYEINIDGKTVLMDANGVISAGYSVVYMDAENPANATIFSDHLTPAIADSKLKNQLYKIYRAPSGTAYIYDIDPVTSIGTYLQLGQAAISEWVVTGVTNSFTLPTTPVNNRIALYVNGVYYDDTNYTLTDTAVVWSGSFNIDPPDTVKVFFF
jgi:hypothetical protein